VRVKGRAQILACCVAAVVSTGAMASPGFQPAPPPAQKEGQPTFRSGVSRVNIGVTARDSRGRLVGDLGRDDFIVMDSGTVATVTDFQVGQGSVSLVAVLDASGSMNISGRLQLAREAMAAIFETLGPTDEAALFSFDSALREVQPFTGSRENLRGALERVQAFGSTSLHDAIAAAARVADGRTHARRAVLIMTDGLDTSSTLTAGDVASVASSVDVPIYILGVSPSARAARRRDIAVSSLERTEGELASLAQYTGGAFHVARSAEQGRAVVEHIVAELRHQYLIGFDPSPEPGWHRIQVNARRAGVVARARAFYWVEGPRQP